jgi:hypothetical protein
MMATVKELLDERDNYNIISTLKLYYDNIDEFSYECALDELRSITPSTNKSDIEIVVFFRKDDILEDSDEVYLECYGYDGEQEWSLMLTEWNDWLNMDIEHSTLYNLNIETILAAIIYEMTFNGFSSDCISKEAEELTKRAREVEEGKSTRLDELIDMFKDVVDTGQTIQQIREERIEKKYNK